MNRDERTPVKITATTPVKITATWNEAGRERAPPENGSSDGSKNRVPPTGSRRASATVIR